MNSSAMCCLHLAMSKLLYRDALLFQLIKEQDIRIVGESSLGADTLNQLSVTSADVLVIEEELEDNDGLTIAETALATLPTLHILMLVEKPIREGRMAIYLDAGLKSVVPKTATIRDLLRALDYVKTGQTYIDPFMHWRAQEVKSNHLSQRFYRLSEREQEVARLISQQKCMKDIALFLGVSQKTVHTYKDRILVKLDMECLPELMLYLSRARQFIPALHCYDSRGI